MWPLKTLIAMCAVTCILAQGYSPYRQVSISAGQSERKERGLAVGDRLSSFMFVNRWWIVLDLSFREVATVVLLLSSD